MQQADDRHCQEGSFQSQVKEAGEFGMVHGSLSEGIGKEDRLLAKVPGPSGTVVAETSFTVKKAEGGTDVSRRLRSLLKEKFEVLPHLMPCSDSPLYDDRLREVECEIQELRRAPR